MVELTKFLPTQFGLSNLANPGILFSLLALVFVLLYCLSLGRTRALISLLSIYIAFVFQYTFPYYSNIFESVTFTQDPGLIRVGIFLLIYVAAFFILNRSLLKSRLSLDETSIFWVLIISVLQLGLLSSIILNTIPTLALPGVPTAFINYLATSQALFYWATVPLIVLLFIKSKKVRRPRLK